MRTFMIRIFCLDRSGATTVGKSITISMTTFEFILRETKFVFGDGVVLCFEVEIVMGFLSDKFENKKLT